MDAIYCGIVWQHGEVQDGVWRSKSRLPVLLSVSACVRECMLTNKHVCVWVHGCGCLRVCVCVYLLVCRMPLHACKYLRRYVWLLTKICGNECLYFVHLHVHIA